VMQLAKKSAPVVKKSPELSPAQQQMFDEMQGSHKGTPKPPSAEKHRLWPGGRRPSHGGVRLRGAEHTSRARQLAGSDSARSKSHVDNQQYTHAGRRARAVECPQQQQQLSGESGPELHAPLGRRCC